VRWKLDLGGEPEELRALAQMYPRQAGREVQVWLEDGRYYLHAPEFETLNNAGAIHERGQLLVTRLNGLLMLTFGGGSRLVEAGNVYQVGAQGGQGVTVFPGPAVLWLPSPSLLTYIGEPIPGLVAKMAGPNTGRGPLPSVEQWVALADHYAPDVDDALLLLTLAVPGEDWRLLYVVFEIVEDLVGKRNLPKLGVSGHQIDRFKHTANSRRALGTKARHGHRRDAAPKRPMTFTEARVLIRRLLLAALNYLARLPR
jgi:hypothetical protein